MDIILFQDQIGKGLSHFLLTAIVEVGLDVSNCGGQGYDNGANMYSQVKDKQAHILHINSEPSLLHVPAVTLCCKMLLKAVSFSE
jgi:hypothetical protein